MRHTYLVCYDISHDLRLRKVHKTMRGFGDHLQYSVFECQLPVRADRDDQPIPPLKSGGLIEAIRSTAVAVAR